MKKSLLTSILFLCTLVIVISGCRTKASEPERFERPNIIYILTDDLGYGDIGCFGATDIKTPNIDRIANEGIKFTSFYSASSVCSPSRAALLTGRLPQRMGINAVFFPESFTGMPASEITIAEILKKQNYTTGLVGKWHLGHRHEFLPLQQGFDEYFGIPYSNDMKSVVYMQGNEVVEYHVDQENTIKTYTKEALNFIENHQQSPFFLYIAHNMPHVPLYASDQFKGSSERGLYGDVVQEIDWSVGEILHRLQELNLLENTLIVFSSDNGPWLVMEEHGGSPGPLREGKQYTFEGGMRVPTVAMWRDKILPGRVYNGIASQMDWLPTFANLTGAGVPEDRPLDGENITSLLLSDGKRSGDAYLYFQGSELRSFREGKWKVKVPFGGFDGAIWQKAVAAHDTLLFDLESDPGERNNLYSKYPDKAKGLLVKMKKCQIEMGELPPSLVVSTPADESHNESLKKKNQ